MTHVAVRNGNLDGALRKFKQKVARDGIPSEFKKREAYDKPGVRRREAKKAGIKDSIPMAPFACAGVALEYLLLMIGG